jgi:TPR repeat protein
VGTQLSLRIVDAVPGLLYKKGEGVSKDLVQAFEWILKAAEQGSASAQNSVGICYEQGEGVEKDGAKAAQFYRKAADQASSRRRTRKPLALSGAGGLWAHSYGPTP